MVVSKGKILLVRHRGEKNFSLPGGGIEKGETILEAAVREVREETQLRAYFAERLRHCDVDGQMARHRVTLVKAGGKVRLQRKEIAEYRWWDGKSKIQANGHIYSITKAAKVFESD